MRYLSEEFMLCTNGSRCLAGKSQPFPTQKIKEKKKNPNPNKFVNNTCFKRFTDLVASTWCLECQWLDSINFMDVFSVVQENVY